MYVIFTFDKNKECVIPSFDDCETEMMGVC